MLTWVLNRRVQRANVEVVFQYGVDVTDVVLLQMEGNVPAVIKCTLVGTIDEGLKIIGSAGRIVVPRAHMAKEAFLYDADGTEMEHFTDQETVNGFTYQIEETMRCVRKGRIESEVVSHQSTMDCAKLFDKVVEAQRT